MLATGIVVLELVLILNPAIILVIETGFLVSLLGSSTAEGTVKRGVGERSGV